MAIEQVITFLTDDGKTFTTREEAEEHDVKLQIMDMVKEWSKRFGYKLDSGITEGAITFAFDCREDLHKLLCDTYGAPEQENDE